MQDSMGDLNKLGGEILAAKYETQHSSWYVLAFCHYIPSSMSNMCCFRLFRFHFPFSCLFLLCPPHLLNIQGLIHRPFQARLHRLNTHTFLSVLLV